MNTNSSLLLRAGIAACLLFSLSVTAAERSAPAVEVAMPIKQVMPELLTVTGSLLANEHVVISPEVAGKVKSLPFTEGGVVQKGELLLQLEDDLLGAELKQAEANYNLAKLRHDRNSTLLKKQSISQSSFDESATELHERSAALEVARIRLEKTRIRAPFTGSISLRNTSVGAFVSQGDKLFHVLDDSSLKLDFRIPERVSDAINMGDLIEFEVTTSGYPIRYQATVTAIQPAISINSRTLLVRATYPNISRDLLSGSFAKIFLSLGNENLVLTVPEQAVIGTKTGYKLFISKDGKAEQRDVKLGIRRDGVVSVTSGLEDGVPVIIAGHQRLREGTPINVVKGQEATQ